MPKDYYAILGVDKSATDSEIKWAFRQRAKSLHPDVNSGDDAQAAFQELNEAYSVLSDSSTRARYDNGELDEPEVTFTWEEVEQILRERELRRQHESRWSSDYGYQSESVYPPMDYKRYERVSQILNLIFLFFAFTFIIDFFVFSESVTEKVISKQSFYRSFKKGPNQSWTVFKTTSESFIVHQHGEAPELGDVIELKRSLFYGNHKFRKVDDSSRFIRTEDLPFVIYILSFLTIVISWLGTTSYLNAERKFNAALISGFLSFAMLIILLYPR